MKIVCFYSYKGGVGRTLSLVNVAYQLSQRKGQRIGLIDLDVEASGLSQILRQSVGDNRDLLSLIIPTNRDLSELENYIVDVSFEKDESSKVFLLPTVSDSALLDRLRWDIAAQQFLSRELFPAFEKLYKLDYLFIDSRTGLSAFAAFALRVADLEVLICRLDQQNRYGISRIIRVCREASKPFKLVVSACPDEGREKYLASFQREVSASVDCVLPYVARLYFEEQIMSKTEPRHRLSKAYASLAEDIQKELYGAT